MANLSFGTFVWPNDPEVYEEKITRGPTYSKDELGNTIFTGISPGKRTITGSGSFFGSDAYANFKALLAMVDLDEPATLNHPFWGSRQVYLTELASAMEPREDYVAYRFTFLEANEDGSVPN